MIFTRHPSVQNRTGASNLIFAFFKTSSLDWPLCSDADDDNARMKKTLLPTISFAFLFLISTRLGTSWDYEGHRIVNQLALASLPTNFPAFVREAETAERVAF